MIPRVILKDNSIHNAEICLGMIDLGTLVLFIKIKQTSNDYTSLAFIAMQNKASLIQQIYSYRN